MALALLAAFAFGPAQAQPTGGGEKPLAATLAACQACHGHEGISESASIPNLAGQKKAYLAKQLEAFKAGVRKNDLMAAIASQLSTAQIQGLAEHWSGLPAAPAAGAGLGVGAVSTKMGFPAGFPAGFQVYETVIDKETVTQRWANDVAWSAASRRQPLPEGSVILVVTHHARAEGAKPPEPGEVISYAGMASQAGWGDGVPPLLRNGSWNFAVFGPDRQARPQVSQAQCLACHRPLTASSHVFGYEALATAAARAPR